MADIISTSHMPTAVRFSIDDAEAAYDEWGANCGPGAIAAIAGLTLTQLRPHMGDFEKKGYTNPTLMWEVLDRLGMVWRKVKLPTGWPARGLVRVQWHGPWMAPNVPRRARYRHTHWVAAERTADGLWIFDINCMCVGGWVSGQEWQMQVAPWLIGEVCKKGDGEWSICDVIEITGGVGSLQLT